MVTDIIEFARQYGRCGGAKIAEPLRQARWTINDKEGDMEDWKEHPEVRYREGYEEGALALYSELRPRLPVKMTEPIDTWLTKKLEPWRLRAQQAAVADKPLRKEHAPRLAL